MLPSSVLYKLFKLHKFKLAQCFFMHSKSKISGKFSKRKKIMNKINISQQVQVEIYPLSIMFFFFNTPRACLC